MRKIYYLLLVVMLGCMGCEWQLKMSDEEDDEVTVDRYDRIQSLYLTTGDFSALQQMNTVYPMQTQTLIEDVLRIGKVNEPEINKTFLRFYQDTTLQVLIAETQQQYASMDDINEQLTHAFRYLRKNIPNMEMPEVYAQIGALDQSVIVGNNTIGICLDKYLGTDYPLYKKPEYGYSQEQLNMMNRHYIVPDCIGFYLLSLYPMPLDRELSQQERDIHIGKIHATVDQLLRNNEYSDFF